jgi:tetratricopeptide (TPR) repeat protein
MFHVPGRYSGGEAASGLFSWTQTLQEVNLKAALPDGTPAGAVRCTFAARKLEVAWGGSDVAPTLTGELSAVVVVDDCLWTVERDGAGKAELLITLRKAVPAVWDRLLATDPAPEAAPELLDGVGREAPENKAEMLRVAKARAARVDFKKNEGNAAFKAGEYQQAAVLYTEAIALDAKQHALHSNRAACFLKLARYEQAKDDALACVALAPEFAKGHFRLGLALQVRRDRSLLMISARSTSDGGHFLLQALERFPEACATFTKVLALDPKNKEAAAGLNMSRMQAERQARAAAGQGTG